MKTKNSLILILLFCIVFPVACNNYKAKEDKEFIGNSRISITGYDEQTIEDLSVLCKVWGFVKYYHPAMATGDYNWDFELFRIMPSVLKSGSIAERNNILVNWIDSLGEVTASDKSINNVDSEKIKQYPDISWIEDEERLGSLSARLIKIRDTERKKMNYYVGMQGFSSIPSFDNEEAYTEHLYPDTGYRLLALFRYWNIIQYYFPYKYLIEEDWKGVIPEFIPQFIDAKDELEYRLTLSKLMARVCDSHAGFTDKIMNGHLGLNLIPVSVTFVEEKAMVTGYMVNDISRIVLKKGDIVLSIDGEPMDSIIKRRLPYISASNYPTFLRNLSYELLRTKSDKLFIEYDREGVVLSDSIACFTMEEVVADRTEQKKKEIFRILQDNIGYLYLQSTEEGSVPNNLDTRGLIIDLRCYPDRDKVKGYWEYNLLYPQPTPFVLFTFVNFKHPGLFTFDKPILAGKNNPDYYKGKKVIIVNERTQSHAEFMAMKYRCTPNTVVIGSTTAGADGNIARFTLPGDINTRITSIGVYYPDKTETQRIGIVPDIEVKPTIKGMRENRDEVLEKAIEIINSN